MYRLKCFVSHLLGKGLTADAELQQSGENILCVKAAHAITAYILRSAAYRLSIARRERLAKDEHPASWRLEPDLNETKEIFMEQIASIERPGLLMRIFFRIGGRLFGRVPTPEHVSWHTGCRSCSDWVACTAPSEWFGKIDAQLRALLNAQVATLYGSRSIEWTSVTPLALKEGVSDEKLTDVLAYPESPHFNERERVALEFCERTIRDDLEVSDECMVRLREHFEQAEIVELAFIIGYQTFARVSSRNPSGWLRRVFRPDRLSDSALEHFG